MLVYFQTNFENFLWVGNLLRGPLPFFTYKYKYDEIIFQTNFKRQSLFKNISTISY